MMPAHTSSIKHKLTSERAQAMAEFAIALPVLLLILVGIFEVGRLMLIYASINNASREAVRYASAYGLNDSNRDKFRDCAAIRQVAKNSAFLINVPDNNIVIEYYRPNKNADGTDVVDGVTGALSETKIDFPVVGVSTADDGVCNLNTSPWEDPDVIVESGDRVKVTVSVSYSPMLRIVPFSPRTITSTSRRTILGVFELDD